MAMRCHVLPFEEADGPANMALDEALLDAVADNPTAALLRTYGWSTPTLSLGYFQRLSEAEADPRWRDVPRVRRPTGGGALWHDQELTYALVVPRTHPIGGHPADLYRVVHEAIAGSVGALGVPAGRRGEADARTGVDRPFLCFLDRDAEDLVAGGRKIVGSAQRRRRGAVLQHGSLLLAGSAATPELAGLGDLADSSSTASDWSMRLGVAIPAALGLEADARPILEAERRRAANLEQAVYRDTGWTARR